MDAIEDAIEIPEPQEEGEEIELPEPEELEAKPLGQDWTEYLTGVQYPREQIAVTREERTGESERDLTGTGFVTTVAYSDAEKQTATEFIPPKETIPLDQRQKELCDQLFDLTVEVLFNNGLPMSRERYSSQWPSQWNPAAKNGSVTTVAPPGEVRRKQTWLMYWS